ncbi:MAG: UDP-N-acetylmuramoyl-L-alanyl-D-glutamate--2,6-diaminopimelate ligase [Betaproteobacteria bacterium]|nr:UDP-N-acetylmuramoyl-L-alanyl-D-glutamate--2,6-diaminopimelate ligase [Betaproteobacteria bacterium]
MAALHNPQQAALWLRQRGCVQLHSDSRQVRAGDGFMAWPGARSDGRAHVADVLARGARACLVEGEGGMERWADQWGAAYRTDTGVGMYSGLRRDSGAIASVFHGHPSQQLDVLAITGTNGKTSTAWWLAHALQTLGRACAVVGTLGMGDVTQAVQWSQHGGLTTPDAVVLQSQLRRFVDQGMLACAIEASSIGLREHRLDGTQLRLAVFTNFSQDHLDYHASMTDYWQAKSALFDWPGLPAAVVNIDDAQGRGLAQQLMARHSPADVWTLSCQGAARLQARSIRWQANSGAAMAGLAFEVCEGAQTMALQTRMVGSFNVSNLLGVIAALRALGHSLSDAVGACADLPSVPGRMNSLGGVGQPLVVVDYAHTPDALEKALQALLTIAQQRQGQLWCVVGCGGERDASKRPLMARVAQAQSDHLVLTSDNPRGEDPWAILAQMQAGLTDATAVHVQVQRQTAIAHALAQAQANDVVLIAGKGHETSQEVAGQRLPFSDTAVASACLAAGGWS